MTLQEYNDLFKLPLLKKMTITSSGGVTITNENIVSEKMSLEKSLSSEGNLRFGKCEAACFTITIADLSHDFTDEWLTVVMDVATDSKGYLLAEGGSYLLTETGDKIKLNDADAQEAQVTLGYFKVFSDKPTNDRRWRELTCYDSMKDILNADVSAWYKGLTFPMTVRAFRDSLFTTLGITQVSTTLANDSFQIQGGFYANGVLSAKTILEAIGELNGVFGQITPDNKFEWVDLNNAPTLTLDYYVDGSGTYEDYTTAYITGVTARDTSDDVGTTVGTNANIYIVENNPLIYGSEGTQALTTALTNLLGVIDSISFRPFEVQTYGNPALPLGTNLTVVTRDKTIVSYVLRKMMTGIQGLRDRYTATSDQKQPSTVNKLSSEITRTKGKTHELEVDVNGLTSRVTATETNLSTNYSTTTVTQGLIQTSATNVLAQVSNTYVTQATYNAEVQNLQDQIDGRIEQYDGNVVPTLNNEPASSWTTDAMKNSHVGDLYRYHYQDQGVDKTDYYRFDKDTSTTPATYSWVTLGQSDVDEALRLANEANEKADAAQAQLDALEDDIDDNYSTTTQMNSAIQLKADSIESTVSSAQSKYNTSGLGYTIDYYGYGTIRLSTQYPPASNNGKHYLDNATGQVYACDGSSWSATGNPLNMITTEISSSVTQANNQIVLKVDNNGKIVKVALGTSASSGTEFKVNADNIAFIANKKIEMTTNQLEINSTNFQVTSGGAVTCSSLTCTGGTIGGWSVQANSIRKTVTISGVEYRPTINAPASPTTNNAAFCVVRTENGTSTYPFIVRYSGKLEATDAEIEGKVTATSGKIGNWAINSSAMYSEYVNGNTKHRVTIRSNQGGASDTAIYTRTTTDGGANYDYPFVVTYDGKMTATKGTVGGWSISSSSLYKTTGSGSSSVTSSLTPSKLTIESIDSSPTDKHKVEISPITIDGFVQTASASSYSRTFRLNSTLGTFDGSKVSVDEAVIGTNAHMVQRTSGYLDFMRSSTVWLGLNALSFNVQSSRTVKKNIKNITESEAKKLLSLRPVSFDYKNGIKNQRGLIAEEVAEIYPEMVSAPEGSTPSIDYSKFVPYLIKMVQMQQKQIDALKSAK